MPRTHTGLGLLASLLGLVLVQATAAAQEFIECPANAPVQPQPTISHQMFSDACISGDFHGLNPIEYFDDYSWRSFLALLWPAKQGYRGMPDSSLPLGTSGRPTVLETFKAEWEIFQPNGDAPMGWNGYGLKAANPCGLETLDFGDVLLAAFSKFDNVVQSSRPPGALLAQNRTYVRHSTGFNERHFQHVVDQKYYLR